MLNNLPIYNIEIDDEGMVANSIVEFPAVESNFYVFEKTPLYFVDELKHRITGVSLRADYPIYREDKFGKGYYITFSKENVEKAVKTYMSKNIYNITLGHKDFTDGLYLLESYFLNENNRTEQFKDTADGSWITTYQIVDEGLWQKILNKEFNGFSVEVFLSIINKKIFSKNMNKFTLSLAKKMNFVKEFVVKDEKDVERTVLVENDVEVGAPVYEYVNDEAVELVDGVYFIDEKTQIVVKNGVIEDVKTVEEEKPVEEEMEEPVEETPAQENEEINRLKKDVETLYEMIKNLEDGIADIKSRMKEMPETVEETLNKKTPKKKGIEKYFNI